MPGWGAIGCRARLVQRLLSNFGFTESEEKPKEVTMPRTYSARRIARYGSKPPTPFLDELVDWALHGIR